MSVLTDVLMEALDNHQITSEDAAHIMTGYYTEGVIKDAVHDMGRVLDASRENKATTIEQLKSNGALKDAEKNVKKYCARAYKTMLKYARSIGVDNTNGVADMQNIINGINIAVDKYHYAEKPAEKTDKTQIDATTEKIIANLNSAKKCFANDGTPNRDELKKLAANTRIEYHNLGVTEVDARAPKPKVVKESADDDFFSEGFLSDMKGKLSKKTTPKTSGSSKSMDDNKPKSLKAESTVSKALSKCVTIRTGANGAMINKAELISRDKDYLSNDIKTADKRLTQYADIIEKNMNEIKDDPSGKKYVPVLNRIANYIKNAIKSKSPKDINSYRESMMGQRLVLAESCPIPNGQYVMEGAMSDLYKKYKDKRAKIDYLSSKYRQNMEAGNKAAAKANLKDMQACMADLKRDLQLAREDRSILETLGHNILWSAAYSAIQILPCLLIGALAANPATVGIASIAYYPALATVNIGSISNLIMNCYQIMNAFDDKGTSGHFHFNDLSGSMAVMARIIDKMDTEINAKMLALN